MNKKISFLIAITIIIFFAILVGGIILYIYTSSWLYNPTETTWKPKEEPLVCTQETRICSDGSVVGRTEPNCEFAECPIEGDLKMEEICIFTTECVGATPTECVKDWLVKIRCQTSAYVTEHMQNFQEIEYKGKEKWIIVNWDFILENENIKCHAIVGLENNNYVVLESNGAFRQYTKPIISKESAINKIKSHPVCTEIKEVRLSVNDRFDGEKIFDDEYGIMYDNNGLIWTGWAQSSVQPMCSTSCSVNAYTGEFKTNSSCM